MKPACSQVVPPEGGDDDRTAARAAPVDVEAGFDLVSRREGAQIRR